MLKQLSKAWVQMYKAAVEQGEQHTPAYVRMRQEAAAKEAEEEAEKKRVWEEDIASKKFWVCRSGCLSKLDVNSHGHHHDDAGSA